jgi:hypothetical protein
VCFLYDNEGFSRPVSAIKYANPGVGAHCMRPDWANSSSPLRFTDLHPDGGFGLALADQADKVEVIELLHDDVECVRRQQVGGGAVVIENGDRLAMGLVDNAGWILFKVADTYRRTGV